MVITSNPPSSQAVSVGDNIVLTCLAFPSGYADTLTTTEIEWTNSTSFSNTSHVIITPVSSGPAPESSIVISSLVTSDSGTYECCVQNRPVGNSYVNDSETVCHSIDISVCKLVHYIIFLL